MADKKRKGLGNLGVDVLLSTPVEPTPSSLAKSTGLDYLPIDLIDRSPYQPRQKMTDEGIQELAESIRSQGLIQPVVVRKNGSRYELIAGERRWRAVQEVGLQEIPAVIKEIDDQSAAAMALIENLQRENLNPIEEAYAVSNLIKEFDWSHQEVAESIGKARATVSNMLRLLDLASDVRQLISDDHISMGHARALLALDAVQQSSVAQIIIAQQLSVRKTEQLVKKMLNNDPSKNTGKAASKDPNIEGLENQIADQLGASVAIQHSAKSGKGKIEIKYNNLNELDGILSKIGMEKF